MKDRNTDKITTDWWQTPIDQLLSSLDINPKQGLSHSQVANSRIKWGSNTVIESHPESLTTLIIEGLKEPMILLLFSIAILSLLFGQMSQAIAMIFVVIIYIVVELINKFRTNNIMAQLRTIAQPTSKVLRDGKIMEIQTDNIVVGDILILTEGVLVPADARLLSSYGLIIDEAILTGESLPITKNAQAHINSDAVLADRKNTVFSGTTVLNGEGTAIVMAVGLKSEIGKIVRQVQTTKKDQTVLQKTATKLAKMLAIFAIIASILIPMIGLLRGLDPQEMILTWLSLTFLMIPGQPPIIITMALALSSFALAKKHIIVKKLQGIEIIAQVTSILSDKTGTITENKMTLESYYTSEGRIAQLTQEMKQKISLALPDYSNNPTDQAISLTLTNAERNLKKIGFSGFADNRPWRDLVYQHNGSILHAITGDPNLLIAQSKLSTAEKKNLEDIVQEQTSMGKRVTAYAYTENNLAKLDLLHSINFVALAVIRDPVRPGVKEAINTLEKAHVRTLIVTGDNKNTAQAIASEIGIPGHVTSGADIGTMSTEKLVRQLDQSHIFARVDPLQKLLLVNTLQRQQEIVAVIGDGVNDAPALKAAHVGIAMGRIGTDLAKEVSDLILTDDNYVHIPDAIKISRQALDNFRKGITYYLSAKCILLIIFLVPLFLGIPFPFAPIQIILIELLMDLASSTIFVTEQEEPGIMEKPAPNIQQFFGSRLIIKILRNSLPLASGILCIYLYAYTTTHSLITAQTAALISWLLGHIFLALNLKQETTPLIKQGLFSNYFGASWLIAMILLSILITNITQLHSYLKTSQLPLTLWIGLVCVTVITTFWIEIAKIINFMKGSHSG